MSELNEMGNMLMNIALQYTHPNFSDMYHDWGAVFKAGEELVKMDKEAELNDNQKIVLDTIIKDASIWADDYGMMDTIGNLTAYAIRTQKAWGAYESLSKKEEAQVLKAFAEWGLEHCQTTDTGE